MAWDREATSRCLPAARSSGGASSTLMLLGRRRWRVAPPSSTKHSGTGLGRVSVGLEGRGRGLRLERGGEGQAAGQLAVAAGGAGMPGRIATRTSTRLP